MPPSAAQILNVKKNIPFQYFMYCWLIDIQKVNVYLLGVIVLKIMRKGVFEPLKVRISNFQYQKMKLAP